MTLTQTKNLETKPFASDRRMELAVWLNFGAHGHIHELLGGTWSKQATAFAAKVSDITQLFAHNSTVSTAAN